MTVAETPCVQLWGRGFKDRRCVCSPLACGQALGRELAWSALMGHLGEHLRLSLLLCGAPLTTAVLLASWGLSAVLHGGLSLAGCGCLNRDLSEEGS